MWPEGIQGFTIQPFPEPVESRSQTVNVISIIILSCRALFRDSFWFCSSVFPLEFYTNFYFFLPYAYYMTSASIFPQFDRHNHIRWVLMMTLLLINFLHPPVCTFLLDTSISLRTRVLKSLGPSFNVRNQISGLYKEQKIIIPLLVWFVSLYEKAVDGCLKWIQIYMCAAIILALL